LLPYLVPPPVQALSGSTASFRRACAEAAREAVRGGAGGRHSCLSLAMRMVAGGAFAMLALVSIATFGQGWKSWLVPVGPVPRPRRPSDWDSEAKSTSPITMSSPWRTAGVPQRSGPRSRLTVRRKVLPPSEPLHGGCQSLPGPPKRLLAGWSATSATRGVEDLFRSSGSRSGSPVSSYSKAGHSRSGSSPNPGGSRGDGPPTLPTGSAEGASVSSSGTSMRCRPGWETEEEDVERRLGCMRETGPSRDS